MRISKRIASLILALAVMALCVVPLTASATEDTYALAGTDHSLELFLDGNTIATGVTTGTFSIHAAGAANGIPTEGAIFKAYKLLNITTDANGYYAVSMPTDPTIKAFWDQYPVAGSMDTITELAAALDADTVNSASIISEFSAYYLANPDTMTALTSTPSDPDGHAQIAGATLGVYAIMQTGAPTDGYIASAPILVCLPYQKVANGPWLTEYVVEPKNTPIAIDKTIADGATNVDEKDTSFGAIESYTINTLLPVYGADVAAVTYSIADVLSTGLTYNSDAVVEISANNVDWITAPAEYYSMNAVAQTLTIDFSTGYKANIQANGYRHARITYTATVNDTALIGGEGNANTATLSYTRTSTDNDGVATDTVKAYSFGMDLNKVDKDNTGLFLPGAEFNLAADLGAGYDDANALWFIETESGIKYYTAGGVEVLPEAPEYATVVTDVDAAHPAAVAAGIYAGYYKRTTEYEYKVCAAGTVGATQTLKVGADGRLHIDGIAEGNYRFKETKAPNGYNLPADAFDVFAITGDKGAGAIGADGYYLGTWTVAGNAAHLLTITNDSGLVIPTTGGIGTVIFTVLGLLLMGAAAMLLFKKKAK